MWQWPTEAAPVSGTQEISGDPSRLSLVSLRVPVASMEAQLLRALSNTPRLWLIPGQGTYKITQ